MSFYTIYTRGCKQPFSSSLDVLSPFSNINEHYSLYEGLEKWIQKHENVLGVVFESSIKDTTVDMLNITYQKFKNTDYVSNLMKKIISKSSSEILFIETINSTGESRTYKYNIFCISIKYQDEGFIKNILNKFSASSSEPIIKLIEINGTYVI